MIMKKEMIRILVALALVLSLATVASAETVKLTGFPYGLTTVYYTFNSSPTSSLAGQFSITRNDVPTWAYCVDLENHISQGPSYDVTPIPVTGNYIQAAWLANQFRAGADTAVESAALQAAIWKAVYGNAFELRTGNSMEFVGYYDGYTDSLPAPISFTGANYVYLEGYEVDPDPHAGSDHRCPRADDDASSRSRPCWSGGSAEERIGK